MQVKRIGVFFTLIKKAFFVFLEYNGLKLSASLSYYTVFSAVPLLIIIMSLAGVFFGELAVEGKVYVQIRELVGSQTALQVQHIIQKIEFSSHGTAGSIIGFVILFFSASGVFSEIQDSINYIWSIKPGPRKRFLHIVIKKLLSFSLLIVMGFILLVSLFINAITALLSERLEGRFPDSTVRIFSFVKPGVTAGHHYCPFHSHIQNPSQRINQLERCACWFPVYVGIIYGWKICDWPLSRQFDDWGNLWPDRLCPDHHDLGILYIHHTVFWRLVHPGICGKFRKKNPPFDKIV